MRERGLNRVPGAPPGWECGAGMLAVGAEDSTKANSCVAYWTARNGRRLCLGIRRAWQWQPPNALHSEEVFEVDVRLSVRRIVPALAVDHVRGFKSEVDGPPELSRPPCLHHGSRQKSPYVTQAVCRIDSLPVHPEQNQSSGSQQHDRPCAKMQQRQSNEDNDPGIETQKACRPLGFAPIVPVAVHRY